MILVFNHFNITLNNLFKLVVNRFGIKIENN